MQRTSGWCLCPEGKEVRFVGQAISSGHGLNLTRLQDFWSKEFARNAKVVLIRKTTSLKIHGWNPKNEGFKKMILLFQRDDFQVSCYVTPIPRFFSLSGGLCLQSRSAWEGGPNTKTRTRNHAESHPNDAWFPPEMPAKCLLNESSLKLKRCSVFCCKYGFYWTYMKLPYTMCLFVCLCDERMGVFSNLWQRNVLRSSSPLTHCQSTHYGEDPNPFSIDLFIKDASVRGIGMPCNMLLWNYGKIRTFVWKPCSSILTQSFCARIQEILHFKFPHESQWLFQVFMLFWCLTPFFR